MTTGPTERPINLSIPQAHGIDIVRFALAMAEGQVMDGAGAHPVGLLMRAHDLYGIPNLTRDGLMLVVDRKLFHDGLKRFVYLGEQSESSDQEALRGYVEDIDRFVESGQGTPTERMFYYREPLHEQQVALGTQVVNDRKGLVTFNWFVQDAATTRLKEFMYGGGKHNG